MLDEKLNLAVEICKAHCLLTCSGTNSLEHIFPIGKKSAVRGGLSVGLSVCQYDFSSFKPQWAVTR
jgi:hypothetical protein